MFPYEYMHSLTLNSGCLYHFYFFYLYKSKNDLSKFAFFCVDNENRDSFVDFFVCGGGSTGDM